MMRKLSLAQVVQASDTLMLKKKNKCTNSVERQGGRRSSGSTDSVQENTTGVVLETTQNKRADFAQLKD